MNYPVHKKASDDSLIKCLIAGGAGFIGSHLCELLLEQNCFVYCVDNFSTGRRQNLNQLNNHPHFQFIEHDLNDNQPLKVDKKLDYVFHVAGIEAYVNGLDADMETLLVNSFGVKNLLELSLEHRSKFLLASSEQVYTKPVLGSEFDHYFGKDRRDQGQQVFLEAKRFSEAITVEYAAKKGVDARIVRLAFLYGPRMNFASGNVLAKLLLNSVKNKAVELPNDGMTVLYPTYITDAVYGLIKAMFSQSSKGKVYGLVQPQPVTLLNLSYLIRDQLKTDLKIKFFPNENLNQTLALPQEVLKSQEALGWYPRENLESGLKKTLNWLKKPEILNSLGVSQHQVQTQTSQSPKPSPRPAIETVSQEVPNHQVVVEPQSPAPQNQTTPTIKPEVVSFGLWQRLKQKLNSKTQPKTKTSKVNFKKPIFWIPAIAVVLLLILLGPIGGTMLLSQQGYQYLNQTQQALEKGQTPKAQQYTTKLQDNWQNTQQLYALGKWLPELVGYQLPDTTTQYLKYGGKLLTIIQSSVAVQQELDKLTAIVFDEQTGDPRQYWQNLSLSLGQSNEAMGFLAAEAEAGSLDSDFFQKIKSQQTQVKALGQVLPIWPDLLAFDDKKTILVLLQDNHELRPTGGFIEGVGILTVEKGRILDFQVKDVYSLDQQLKGTILPPDEIKEYLGEDSWWLRDANFSPDFPQSAARAAWFVQKEMGITVDGVVATNLYFFQKLLEKNGELFLPEFGEKVNAANLADRAQQHAQINVFTNDGESKSFLLSLAKNSFAKIKSQKNQDLMVTTLSMYQSLESGDLQIWLPDTNSESKLNQLGWDGALRDQPTELLEFGQLDASDYWALFEANFGVNKANYYVERSLDYQVNIDDLGQIEITTITTFVNQSMTEAWPGGEYKNYLRFYLPSDIKLEEVLVGESDDSLVKLSSKKITRTKEDGKQIVGLYVEIPPQSQQIIKLSYQLGQALPINNQANSYALYLQKQSGVAHMPYQVMMTFPQQLKPTKLSEKAVSGVGSLQFQGQLDQDQVIAVSFLK